jgi:hypothetical protein
MFVRHKVNDYAAWRKFYDDFDRKSLGATAHAVYQNPDDPSDITVTHDFDTLATAKAFAESDELREVMGRAGVVGQPDIWFADPA